MYSVVPEVKSQNHLFHYEFTKTHKIKDELIDEMEDLMKVAILIPGEGEWYRTTGKLAMPIKYTTLE